MEPTSDQTLARTCPYLGTWSDSGAFLSYASSGNICYHCYAPVAPLLSHQDAFCLSSAHADCPVFSQSDRQAFPPSLKAEESPPPVRRGSTLRLPGVVIVVLLVVLAGVRLFPKSTGHALMAPSQISSARLEPSLMPPTSTSSPIPTPTIRPKQTDIPVVRALEVPVTIDGIDFLLHRVRVGESFDTLADTYNTTPVVIHSLNSSLSRSKWVDTVIVISPGLQDVDPALPAFEAYQVPDSSITLDDLSAQLNVSSPLISHYNACSGACTFSPGDWLLIPYSK